MTTANNSAELPTVLAGLSCHPLALPLARSLLIVMCSHSRRLTEAVSLSLLSYWSESWHVHIGSANAIEGLLSLSSTIQIQVVYVSVIIGGQGGTFDATYAAAAVAALNAAYARVGFNFTLAANYAANFSTFGAAKGDGCGIKQPEANCGRCSAYEQAAAALQSLQALFIYGVPASSKCPECCCTAAWQEHLSKVMLLCLLSQPLPQES